MFSHLSGRDGPHLFHYNHLWVEPVLKKAKQNAKFTSPLCFQVQSASKLHIQSYISLMIQPSAHEHIAAVVNSPL